MSKAEGALVCGFGDVAAGLGGLAWELGGAGALLLSQGEVRPATFAIEEGGDAATVLITAGDQSLEATLTPQAASVALAAGDEGGGAPAVTACAAEVRSAGGTQTFRCPGQISRWSGNPLEGAATFRHLAIEAGDALLIAGAVGPPGAEGHSDERTSAWLIEGEDASPFEEALISTQYDGAGDPTRAGLELWPEDAERASRAAASRVSASVLGGARTGGTWAGLLSCHTDGTEGLGSYLLWRA